MFQHCTSNLLLDCVMEISAGLPAETLVLALSTGIEKHAWDQVNFAAVVDGRGQPIG
jgi:hypothetical protein